MSRYRFGWLRINTYCHHLSPIYHSEDLSGQRPSRQGQTPGWPSRRHRVVSPHFALNRTGRGGRQQNPIRADHLRRATGLSVFGLLHYRDRRHGRLHSPRAERMTEKSPVTPSVIIVQMKKKAPLDLAIPLATPTPAPFMWRTGGANARSALRSMMMYPDRRSASTSVP